MGPLTAADRVALILGRSIMRAETLEVERDNASALLAERDAEIAELRASAKAEEPTDA